MMRARGAVPPGCTASSSMARTARAVPAATTRVPGAVCGDLRRVTGISSPSRANMV
jgi:hypothetical protein